MKAKLSIHFFQRRHIILFGVLCLFMVVLQAQIRPKQLRKEVLQSQATTVTKTVKGKKGRAVRKPVKPRNYKPLAPTVNPLKNKNATIVYMENSESMSYNAMFRPDVQVLKGNVRFRHDNALLYCDSAYFYEKANSLDAFGHVRIVQGDTLHVYGDILYYDGNSKLARMRRNVRMVNKRTTLITDSLNYDRAANLAYYYTGGKIKDPLNTLTSIWGQYSPASNEALFKKNVHLINKNFILNSDTLNYNTKTSIANIVGPTHILYKNETDIYSSLGWYNTATERSMLLKRSLIIHKDGKTMTGDTIFYDKKHKYGEGFTNVILNDTAQKSTLTGDYVYYNETLKKGIASDSALLIDWSSKDTMFVHSDTLFTSKDSIYDVVRGYNHTRIFRNDVQGLCDSIAYSSRDSVLNMSGEPVLWTENNQLSGEFIQAFTKNQKVNRVFIQREAMAVQHEDSVYYNQLSGKEIIAHLDSGQVRKVNVNGNAETIYYPKDEKDSSLVGLNKTQSSFVVMYMKNKKVDRIVMTTASSGTMYPLGQLSGTDLYLKNFVWLDEQRPKNKKDLFLIFPKTVRPKGGAADAKDASKDLKGKGSDKTGNKTGKSDAVKAVPVHVAKPDSKKPQSKGDAKNGTKTLSK